MAKIITQQTSLLEGDTLVYDDGTVTLNGVIQPDAVVSVRDKRVRCAMHGGKKIDINPWPPICSVIMTRVEAGNKDSYIATLGDEMIEGFDPTTAQVQVYKKAHGKDPDHITDPFELVDGVWTAECPEGEEPGDKKFYAGLVIGGEKYSTFKVKKAKKNEVAEPLEFMVGGDLPEGV